MRICVLGAAAGGGFPQWNAADDANRRARSGDPAARPASQASIAVSADGERYAVINASPDIRAQIGATPALHPRNGLRSSPIAAVVLTNGDVDAVAGLLTLREGTAFALYAHAKVHDALAANPIFGVLDPAIVPRRVFALGTPVALSDAGGSPLGITVTPYAVPGKAPLYLEADRSAEALVETDADDTIALEIRAGDTVFHYVANCAHVDEALAARLRSAGLVFFDGTLWRDDEMIAAGVGAKTGQRMGHMAMDGEAGAMARLEPLGIARTVFIHINNTNPVLLDGSPERKALQARGFEVAHDGMEITL